MADMNRRDNHGKDYHGRPDRRNKRKKICHMCTGKDVDYKDVLIVSKYIGENAKILPRRFTGTCARHQRHVAMQIKRAREMALIPFTK